MCKPLLSLLCALWAAPLGATQTTPPASETPLAARMATVIEPHFAGFSRESPRYVPVRDGWVTKSSMQLFRFFNPDLFPPPEDPSADPTLGLVNAIADAHEQLARRGVELLVVPIPTRLNIYPEVLVGGQLDAGCAPGLERFNARLRARGVEVLDLLPHLVAERASFDAEQDDLVCLRANGHWTPKGAGLAARAIADHVRSRSWYEAPAHTDSRLERFTATWQPDGEVLAEGVDAPVLEFERVVAAAGEKVERTNKHSPIVLWGDSFTVIFKAEGADLPRRLHHLLGGPIDVIASQGSGPDTTRITFGRRGNATDGKQIVIWAFATRSLLRGKWEKIRLHRPPR